MDTYNPLESGRATGDHSRHHGDNENDTELLPDRTLVGNTRRLIRVEGGAPLYEVFVISSYFELVSDCGTQRFDELWEGIIGQIRLAERNAK
jgi:hypothetical protein